MKLENVIYCGDNLTWLKKFPDNCIDLIYIDPLFFSNKYHEVIFFNKNLNVKRKFKKLL